MKGFSRVGAATAILALSTGGCDLVAGIGTYCEVNVDCPTAGAGGTTGSGGGAGGSGAGAGGVGTSAGGGGAAPFACVPAGAEFEVLAAADIPGANNNNGEFFLVAEPSALPPKAHVVTRLDQQTGTLVVRTVKGANALGAVVTWTPPAGSSRYVDGYATADEVVVLGRITGASGPTLAEIHFAKDQEDQVPASAMGQSNELPRPLDCDPPAATIDSVAFARDGAETHYMVTWDECAAGERRLYRSTPTEPQIVRKGDKSSASLILTGYAHAGNSELALFSDGASSGYSFGASAAELAAYQPVSLGETSTLTAPIGAVTVGANAMGVFWAVLTEGSIAPASILGRVGASDQLAELGAPADYTVEATYPLYEGLTRWGGLSVGATTLVTGGVNLDQSEVRFSVMSKTGQPLSMDNVVTTGDLASIGSVSAAPFGPKQVLVVWKKISGASYTVRGRIYGCD